MTFKKTCRSKSNLDTILCQFSYFICIITFDKLSKLQQISCKFLIKWQYKIPYIKPRIQTIILKIGTNGEYLFQNTKLRKFL